LKETPWGVWDPLNVGELADVLRELQAPWWIAGEYVLEAFAGHSWRKHDDIDAGMFRGDQLRAREALSGWGPQAADPPGTLRP
jgi:hypothetical protein